MTDTLPCDADVWRVLQTIPDPEFGISIVDLGLIYSVSCTALEIRVVMTLTTPTCPSGGWIHAGVEAALQQLPGARKVQVALVFEPAWNPAMLSDAGRRQLGWSGDTAN